MYCLPLRLTRSFVPSHHPIVPEKGSTHQLCSANSYHPRKTAHPLGDWKFPPKSCLKGSTSWSYIFMDSEKNQWENASFTLLFFGHQGTCDLPAKWHYCWDVLARPVGAHQVMFHKVGPLRSSYKWGYKTPMNDLINGFNWDFCQHL